jgi:hypothetical protein
MIRIATPKPAPASPFTFNGMKGDSATELQYEA